MKYIRSVRTYPFRPFLYNKIPVTNNIIVNDALVYISAIIFVISVFPIYIYNYIYINTEEKYASINITLFRFIKLYNINTVKNKPNSIEFNGKSKNISLVSLKTDFYRVFNKLCVYKVIQLSDFGVKNQDNAYAVLAQYGITTALYKLIQTNGNYSKLRNYIVLNEEHSTIRYYAKAVTIINVLVIIKIFLILIMEKLDEFKIKKKQRQGI